MNTLNLIKYSIYNFFFYYHDFIISKIHEKSKSMKHYGYFGLRLFIKPLYTFFSCLFATGLFPSLGCFYFYFLEEDLLFYINSIKQKYVIWGKKVVITFYFYFWMKGILQDYRYSPW